MRDPIDLDAVLHPAFSLCEDMLDVKTDWHSHGHDQLLYAAEGMLHLVVEDAQWLLPPQRAAWIPAGTLHRVTARAAELATVYFEQDFLPGSLKQTRVFDITALGRELMLYARRYGPERLERDPAAERLFFVLGELGLEWAAAARPWRLPVARSGSLQQAMSFALERLDEPIGMEDAAKAAGVSVRTLARRFVDETGMSWRQFLHDARLLKAMDLLSLPGARVTEVAFEVGFESLGAFTVAFERFAGELPRDYRRRFERVPHATARQHDEEVARGRSGRRG
jgi:AraC-like DNA-binding protein